MIQNQGVRFRRPKRDLQDAFRWREFLASEADTFARAGLSDALTDQRLFDYFLMHGYLPKPGGPADGILLDAEELAPQQREALGQLVATYLENFDDPGVDVEIWLQIPK